MSQIVLYQLKSVYFFPFNITNLIVETLKFLRRKFHFTSSYKLSVTTWVWMAWEPSSWGTLSVRVCSTIWKLEKIIFESIRAFERKDSVSRDGAIFQFGQMWEKGSMIWQLVWFFPALCVCVLGERGVMSWWWDVRGAR